MRKAACILLVVALSIAMSLPAIAGEKEQLETQLVLKQTQMRAINAEFRLASQLIQNLQDEATIVNQDIAQIRRQLNALEAAKKDKKD